MDKSTDKEFELIEKYKDNEAVNFASWLMENCQLYEDQSLWSYEGEDYSLEGLYEVFKTITNHKILKMIKIKIEFYKETGKWYTNEEAQVSSIHNEEVHQKCIELHRNMVAVVYIIEDDGHLQPFRFFNT